jgi:hypothetical protein
MTPIEAYARAKNNINEGLENKVDKIEGKGLSTNDYTTKEKEELAKLFDYNALIDLISNPIELNKDYILGGGAKTNKGNDIKVKCIFIEDNIVMMQTYGVTASEFPGWDLTESYSSYFGDLSSAISEVELPSRDVIIENHIVVGKVLYPSVISEEVLKTAASNYELFGGESDGAWLAAGYPPSDVDYIESNGKYYSWASKHILVCAPYFTLDLSKIMIKDEGIIELRPDKIDIIDILKEFKTKIKEGN